MINFENLKSQKVFVAGHNGMVGSAITNLLYSKGFSNLIKKNRNELNLLNQKDVELFFKEQKPKIVILCAAKVGGIQANINSPASFLYENLVIQNNVIMSSFMSGVERFIFLGSSCIYPRNCPQPIKEEYLLTGPLEPTNEGYAIAKITGLKLLESLSKQHNFNSLSLMPSNLYGPNDSFDPVNSHVLTALIKKIVDAKNNNVQELIFWGSGVARRELMHVNDLARAILFVLEHEIGDSYLNVGTGFDISINELVKIISDRIDYNGKIDWDITKPDGMLRKCLDVTKLEQLGFKAQIGLSEGIDEMINIYRKVNSK